MFSIYFDSEEDEYYCAKCARNHPSFEDFEGIGDTDIENIQQSIDEDEEIICSGCDKLLIELD